MSVMLNQRCPRCERGTQQIMYLGSAQCTYCGYQHVPEAAPSPPQTLAELVRRVREEPDDWRPLPEPPHD